MKIAILHENLEFSEKSFKEIFEKDYNSEVKLFKISEIKLENILDFKPDLTLNRVYASVANYNYSIIEKTLNLLKELENKGIISVNSYETSLYDYNKFEQFKIMKQNNVPTPDTILIDDNIDDFLNKYRYPIMLKRNTGGRGKDILKIDNENELYEHIKITKDASEKENYHGGYILQEFVKSNRPYDCRIGIVNGKFGFAHARTLISEGDEDVWLASLSKGSKLMEYSPSEEEIEIAKNATKSIGALFNEVDMTFTNKGPIIIENNPTPNYDKRGYIILKQAVDVIMKNLYQ